MGVLLLLLAAVFAHDFVGSAVGRGRENIPIVQERILGLSDVHERRLEPWLEILDFAFENRADHAFVAGAFDFELLHNAVREQRDAFFKGFYIDDDFAVGFVLAFEQFYDFLEKRAFFCAQLGFEIELLFGNRFHDFLRRFFRQIVDFVIGVFLFHCFAVIFFAKLPSIRNISSDVCRRFEPDPEVYSTSIRKFRHNSSLATARP